MEASDFQRFSRRDKMGKLPRWIQEYMTPGNVNLSIEEAAMIARKWLPLMAQPFTKEHQLGVSLLTEDMLAEDELLDKKFGHVLEEID
ncbi:unnamed protein product [Gongylonema pulchrum]|uniref:Uncharacterized protein n=1 Tax=Gongylonema pulchrum TaxID=637853 RepID=A0A183CWS3_9BILA|nr:unnamed protein product [Gongylonema pulchrum]